MLNKYILKFYTNTIDFYSCISDSYFSSLNFFHYIVSYTVSIELWLTNVIVHYTAHNPKSEYTKLTHTKLKRTYVYPQSLTLLRTPMIYNILVVGSQKHNAFIDKKVRWSRDNMIDYNYIYIKKINKR